MQYYEIPNIEISPNCIYSAKEFEQMLTERFIHKKLKKIFFSYFGQIEFEKTFQNQIGSSEMGNMLLLFFEDSILYLRICCEGLMQYWIFNPCEIKIKEVPTLSNIYNRGFIYDLQKIFTLNYEDQEINKITIHKTDQCSFFQPEFNKEEIEKSVKKADLPLGVSFHLKNKNSIHLMGDEIENYTISITANN